MNNMDPPEQPLEGFFILCVKCRSANIQLQVDSGWSHIPDDGYGSGESGGVVFRCRDCGNTCSFDV